MLELHDLTHEDDWRSNRLLHYPRALQKGASGRKGGGGRKDGNEGRGRKGCKQRYCYDGKMLRD